MAALFNERGGLMAKVINCECGQVIRGESDDELLTKAEQHVNENHPELVGKVSREDLLNMAEEG
jgi:predicted small metal-binding protein